MKPLIQFFWIQIAISYFLPHIFTQVIFYTFYLSPCIFIIHHFPICIL
jgi:hypothetical protein